MGNVHLDAQLNTGSGLTVIAENTFNILFAKKYKLKHSDT